jgi:calcineurin-like phosphoesterase family protein
VTTFYTSDLHFGHANIIGYCDRPWETVEEMNAGLVDNWNKVVSNEDTVFVLGDLCWGDPRKYTEYLTALNGEKRLVPGNHDFAWEGHSRQRGVDTLAQCGWIVESSIIHRTINDELVKLCHFPYRDVADEQYGDQYVEHRPINLRAWLLHGHVHTQWRLRDKMINVGCDVWNYLPVAEEYITLVMQEKSSVAS